LPLSIASNSVQGLPFAEAETRLSLLVLGALVCFQSFLRCQVGASRGAREPSSWFRRTINVACALGGIASLSLGLFGTGARDYLRQIPAPIQGGSFVVGGILAVWALFNSKGAAGLWKREPLRLDPGSPPDQSKVEGDGPADNGDLSQEAFRFEALVRASKDGVIGVDQDGKVWHWNPAAQELFKVASQDMIGRPLSDLKVYPAGDLWQELTSLQTFPYESSQRELEVARGDGSIVPVWFSISAFPRLEGGRGGFGLIARDMSEKRRIEERVSEALIQKNLILKELHHRVKNNLQLICSLLRLQAKETADEQALKLFRSSEERIRALAVVHDRLYRSPSFSSISFAECLRDLVDQIVRGVKGLPPGFEVDFQLDEVDLPIDSAITCALVANELVAERLKSAVHKHLEGFALRVFLKKDGESLRLGLWDNGCEVSDSTARSNGGSLGLSLVRALLKQVRGELEINQFDGVLFTVTLPESIFVDQSRGPAHRSSL